MSNPVVSSTNHPSDETLAALVDGRLDEPGRQRVVEHMVACERCYSIWSAVADSQALSQHPDDFLASRRREWRLRGRAFWSVAAAAALVLGISGVLLSRREGEPSNAHARIAEASTRLAQRNAESRWSGQVHYQPYVVLRGPSGQGRSLRDVEADELLLATTVADLQQQVLQNPSPENLHALGVGWIALGRGDDSVSALIRALAAATGEDDVVAGIRKCKDATLLNDLAAAHLLREVRESSPRALLIAVESAESSWRIERRAETAWNRALAIEQLQLTRDAADAWRDYLRLDANSEWAEEARRHLRELEQPGHSELWSASRLTLKAAVLRGDDAAAMRIINQFPHYARAWVEDEILTNWADATKRADVNAADENLSIARKVAIALATTGHDALLDDSLTRVQRSSAPLAVAVGKYAAARREYKASRYQAAAELFSEAARDLNKLHSPFAVLARAYEASAVYYQDDFSRAVEMSSSVCGLREEVRYPTACGRALWVRGIAQAATGDLSRAITTYSRAASLFESARDAENAIAIADLIVETQEMIGELDESWRARMRTLAQLRPFGETARRVPQTVGGAARAAMRDGFLRVAVLFTSREIVAAERTAWHDLRVIALLRRAKLHARLGEPDAARAALGSAAAVAETIADHTLRRAVMSHPDYVSAMADVLPSPERRLSAIADALQYAREIGDAQREIELQLLMSRQQLARGATHDAAMALDEILPVIDRQYVSFETLSQRDAYLDQRQSIYNELAVILARSNEAERALRTVDRGRGRAIVGAIAPDVSTPDLIHALHGSDTIVIYYLATDTDLLVWTVAGRLVRLVRRPLDAAVLQRVANRLATASGSAFEAAVKDASALLVEPWASNVGNQNRIVFVPDRATADVPFSALEMHGRPLIERFAVTTVPSLTSYAMAMRRDAELTGRGFVAFAVGFGRKDLRLPDLPFATAEAQTYQALYGAKPVLGEAATERAFVAAVQAAEIVHVSAHAIPNLERPWLSRILLAPEGQIDGSLYVHEIARLRLRATRLVVLATCASLKSGKQRREGFGSIGRAFFAAGVPLVIGSVRPVDDRAAAAFSRHLYAQISKGADPIMAVRTAQLSMRDLYPRSVWSSFQIIGGVADRRGKSWLL